MTHIHIGIFLWSVCMPFSMILVGYSLGVSKTSLKHEHESALVWVRTHPESSFCGYCSAMPPCEERCVEHDECGPWCCEWRKLVYDGVIKDTGIWNVKTDDVLRIKKANEKLHKER